VVSARSIVLLLAALGAACSANEAEDASEATDRRLRALTLTAANPQSSAPEIQRYRRLRPGPDSDWTVKNGESELVPLAGDDPLAPQYALVLDSTEGPGLLIPGPFDGRAFNSVAVEVELQAEREFSLELISAGNLSSVRGLAESKAVAGRQWLRFVLPALYSPSPNVSRLRLWCFGKTNDLVVHSVDLLLEPLELRLPGPASGPDLILVRGERRRGVGLAAQHGLRSACDAEAGSVLRFSYAAPGTPEGRDDAAALRLELRSASGRSESHDFRPLGDGEYAWHEVRLPLDAFAGDELELLWEVTSATPAPWALAEVGLLHGTGQPKRVLLITSDTHRADHLGAAHAGVQVRTPNLDALARRGVLFEDCFVTTNITNPSHVALMTARHPRDSGILGNDQPVSLSAATLAEAFQGSGFATFASLSVRHLDDPISGLGQGFDRLSAPRLPGLRDGNQSLDELLAWLDTNDDVPLFLWLHLYDAHVPYAPPNSLLRYYYPNPEAAFDPAAPAPEGIPEHVYQSIFPGLKDLDYPKALYAGEVTFLDRVLPRLFEHPSLADAVIAFTADHGESLGQHGIFYAHADLFPDCLRVPLILSYPGAPAGERRGDPVQQLDLGRTLLDLVGLFGVEFPGSALVGADTGARRPSVPRFAIGAGAATASITQDGWHLILALDDVRGRHRVESRPRHQVTLYDLARDPQALIDRVDTDFERTKLLRRRLLDWLAQARDLGWRGARVTDAETLRSLEALGYTTGGADEPAQLEFYAEGCECAWCERFDG
jgi:arylsulfatase A-like enzyme